MSKYLSLEERLVIEQSLKEGHSIASIATRLGRSYDAIRFEVSRMPKGEYCAKTIHDNVSKAYKERAFRNRQHGRINKYSIPNRIAALEQQMEIVLDYIKSLRSNEK